ncbi:MAG: hypothetical protein ACM3PP_05005 [Candidatus Saccharibacteria bacterium]
MSTVRMHDLTGTVGGNLKTGVSHDTGMMYSPYNSARTVIIE